MNRDMVMLLMMRLYVCSVFISRHKYNRFIKKRRTDIFAENKITIRMQMVFSALPHVLGDMPPGVLYQYI